MTVVSTAIAYVLGTAWFCISTGTGVMAALATCVFPFIPGDIAKMVIAIAFGPMLRRRLNKAGVI